MTVFSQLVADYRHLWPRQHRYSWRCRWAYSLLDPGYLVVVRHVGVPDTVEGVVGIVVREGEMSSEIRCLVCHPRASLEASTYL